MAIEHIHVKTKAEAWKVADAFFNGEYIKDEVSTRRAGYPVFRNTSSFHYYTYICDLGDRLEVNLENNDTYNIWIMNELLNYTDISFLCDIISDYLEIVDICKGSYNKSLMKDVLDKFNKIIDRKCDSNE